MLRLTLSTASAQAIYIAEVPSFQEANAVVRSLNERQLSSSWDEYKNDPILRFWGWEGSHLYAENGDGKVYLLDNYYWGFPIPGNWTQI